MGSRTVCLQTSDQGQVTDLCKFFIIYITFILNLYFIYNNKSFFLKYLINFLNNISISNKLCVLVCKLFNAPWVCKKRTFKLINEFRLKYNVVL